MAADNAAVRLGLKAGMSVAHAQALVPDLMAAEHDSSGDAAGLQALAAWAMRRYSPIATPDPPDGLFIDSTGCDHLFGGEAAMLADLRARLTSLGIAVRIGMADTPGAAYAVARYAADPIAIVRTSGTEEALRSLPVAALRIPADIVTSLHDLGFRQIGQVLDVPRSSLVVRFGQVVGQRLDWALGTRKELISPSIAESLPHRRLSFAEPIASPAGLERAMRDLSDEMAADLERRGIGARHLDLLFERVDSRVETIRVGLAQPSRDPHHFIRLFRERLDTVDPGFGIDAVSLVASHIEPLPPHQLASAVSDAELDTNLCELVDRLANLPCVRRVLRFAPVESDLPERSVRALPAVAPPENGAWPAWPRPTRLLHPPAPIDVTPADIPAKFIWRGHWHRICKLDGPERIHGEWWRAPEEIIATRDYYRVEDETGAQFWIVHLGDSWRLQGLFG
jgi:protein ImuB